MNIVLKTRITELFGIERPIIQGGMHCMGQATLAVAVSNAGGLGLITSPSMGTPERQAAEIIHGRLASMLDARTQPTGRRLTRGPSWT